MKKIMFITIFLILIANLASCSTPDENSLFMTLNPGIDTIGIHETHFDTGAKAQYGFKNLDVEVTENTVDSSTIGTYQIVYHATYLDYENTMIRYVTVVDDIPPTVTLQAGIDTIFVGGSWTDMGVLFDDNSDEQVNVLVRGTVNTSVEGTYEIIYEAVDQSGNVTIVTRYVNVLQPE